MNANLTELTIPTYSREQHFQQLLDSADGSANCIWLAQIIASWLAGEGVLPDHLGLSADQYEYLLALRFPGYQPAAPAPSGKKLNFSRMLEKHDLEELLRQYAREQSLESECLIAIIVAACLGSDHLWQDLGLWSRNDLSALLKHNFPEITVLNSRDMKWKKFLYKQLCEAEGIYVCRAPSCEVCKDYPLCFGAED